MKQDQTGSTEANWVKRGDMGSNLGQTDSKGEKGIKRESPGVPGQPKTIRVKRV